MKKFFLLVATLFAIAASFLIVSSASALDGEKIFKKKCKVCHNPTCMKKIGPGLAGIVDRTTKEWAKKWVANPQATWEKNEGYTVKLRKKVKNGEKRKKTLMKFKVVKGPPTPEEAGAAIDYIFGLKTPAGADEACKLGLAKKKRKKRA